MHTPRHLHLAAIRHIIRYLIGTLDTSLFFTTNSSTMLMGYSYADWVGCMDTHCSITGWCIFLESAFNGEVRNRITFPLNQSIGLCHLLALRLSGFQGLLAKIGYPQLEPTSLHANNISAIQIAANPVFHERIKHIEMERHSIREAYDGRIIYLPHVTADVQIDMFTKEMTRR